MLAEGKARGLAMPLVENTLACYQEVVDKGLGRARSLDRLGLLVEARR